METRKNDNLFSLDGAAFVTAAYRAFLFREPDSGGRKVYLKLLAEGYTKEDLVLSILSSPESLLHYSRIKTVRMEPFSAEPLFALADDGLFLRAAYLVLLGRPIDEIGLNYFQNGLWDCTLDRTDILLALMRSPEGKQHGVTLLDFDEKRRKRLLRNLVYRIPLFGRAIRFLRTQKFKTAVLNRRLAELQHRVEQIEQREERVGALEQRLNRFMSYSKEYNEAGLTEDERRLYHMLNGGTEQ